MILRMHVGLNAMSYYWTDYTDSDHLTILLCSTVVLVSVLD